MLLCSLQLSAQEIIKDTFHYATNDNVELYLDRYTSATPASEPQPAMIFAFGGGFVGGTRDRDFYYPYFQHLAENGIVVVSIDYRLGLKNLPSDNSMVDMIGYMNNAVNIAVEDMYSATNFLITNAKEWNIDTSKIMVSGSSAGAITALQAEWLRDQEAELAKVLPDGFHYAGVVSCAGALFSTKGGPKFSGNAAPMLLFHGTSDSNVPYNKASIMGIGFYGSQYIVKQLDKLQSPYLFCSMEYADHSVAVTPLIEQTDLILQFINDYVVEGNRLCVKYSIRNLETEPRPTHFTARKYLKTNYAK
jgi:predicted esterase